MVKDDLKQCIYGNCSRCSQHDKDSDVCYTNLKRDALEYIERLEERIAIMTECEHERNQ